MEARLPRSVAAQLNAIPWRIKFICQCSALHLSRPAINLLLFAVVHLHIGLPALRRDYQLGQLAPCPTDRKYPELPLQYILSLSWQIEMQHQAQS